MENTFDVNYIKNEFDTLRNEMKNKSINILKQFSQYLFAKYPKIHSIEWTQYTPHFNDGDECIFQVNCDDVTVEIYKELNNTDLFDMDDINNIEVLEWVSAYGYNDESRSVEEKAAIELNKLLHVIGDDSLRDIFGDHVSVKMLRDNFQVEEYDHD